MLLGLGEETGDRLGSLLIQLVEVVIQIHRDRDPDAGDTVQIAASCLRLCGLDSTEVAQAEMLSEQLLTRQPG